MVLWLVEKEGCTLTYYLAIDIGASSGRHILGSIADGKLVLEEIYRFENGMQNSENGLVWDIEHLTSEVINGIAKCSEIGKIPSSVAIDTWGVDYVLLDGEKQVISPVYAYRNSRHAGVQKLADFPLTFEELYKKTGIQHFDFNTVYQLYCDAKCGRTDKAKHFLMIPDYLSYRLTGVMKNEYTIASTSAMANATTKEWDGEIIEKLGINKDIFLPLSAPGEVVGDFTEEVAKKVGFSSTVILAPSHDTASAVAACPLNDKSAFISSGTWSIFGTENTYAVTSDAAMEENFSNEGGIEYRFRFLKNIMGMWLFQSVRRNLDKKYTYDEMMQMAMESRFDKTINVNDRSLVAPESMIKAVNKLAGDENLPIGDTLSCLYHSLASMYANCVSAAEKIAGKSIDNIFIVGGGSKDAYLNSLTKKYTGKKVVIGLSEATATGNLASQIMRDKGIGIDDVREIIKNSFNIREI